MKNWSLRSKTFLLLASVVIAATVPLISYFVVTARGLARFGDDPVVTRVLGEAVRNGGSSAGRNEAALALTRYGQIQALRSSIVRQVIVVSVAYCALIILVSLGLGYLFTSRITRPLAILIRATGEFAMDRLDYRLPITTGGEIGTLIHSFNDMADKLLEARREKVLAERKATWQRVARVIAHEIKNPLTPIKLSTERMYEKFLLQSRDFPEVIKGTTATVLHEIENLQKLVESFHTYAKFPDPVPALASVNDIVSEVCGLFTGPDVRIVRDLAPDLPPLMIDRGQIGQALMNIVKNAVEAIAETGRPGTITVATRIEESHVVIRVRDDGPGIASHHRDRLFQPYFTTKKQGSGIGLALTERIVSLHQGDVACDSTPGEGTVITVFLPIRFTRSPDNRHAGAVPGETPMASGSRQPAAQRSGDGESTDH